MPAARDRAAIVAAVHDTFDALVDFGRDLTDEQWDTPSEVPGWTVKDNYSHVIGTELMLLGRPDEGDPVDAPHVKNDIGRFNELSIGLRRDRSGAEVLAELAMIAGERKAALEAVTDEEWEEVGFTPAGRDTHGRFMQVRVFDCWIHEQDCREPLGLPGHLSGPAVDVALDELAGAMGYVIGKKVGAADGQSVRLQLTGETARIVDVRVDGRAAVVDDLTDPTTTITIPTALWFRYAAGRRPVDPTHTDITIEGDQDLGRRTIENSAYTI